LHLWRVKDAQRIDLWPGSVLAIRVARGQEKIVCADSDTGVYVLDLRTRRIEHTLGRPAHWIALDVSPDGKWIAAAFAQHFSKRPKPWTQQDYAIHVWQLGNPGEVRQLLGNSGPVTAIAFHPTRPELVSWSWDRILRRWDVEKEVQLASSGEPKGTGSFSGSRSSLAVDARGRHAMLGGGLFRFDTLDRAVRTAASSLPLSSGGCFSFDGKQYAKGYQDGTVRILDMQSRRELASMLAFRNNARVDVLAFSPSGELLATGGTGEIGGLSALQRGVPAIDRAVRIWKVSDITAAAE
jgi:WD40 repeat protein